MTVAATERLEMLGAALDLLDEGVAVLDTHLAVVYWNDAAAALTGHQRIKLLSHPCPRDLYRIDEKHAHGDVCGYCSGVKTPAHEYTGPAYSGQMYTKKNFNNGHGDDAHHEEPARATLVVMRHQLGHTFPVMLRRMCLRDGAGNRLGTALLFRAIEESDELPHGEAADGTGIQRSQAEIEDRLEAAFHEWHMNAIPFGLLWITVDQAAGMRRTHGRDACEAMLKIVEHRLAQALRPNEVIGRWGNEEFLVLSHERTAEMLFAHGKHLAGITRTADFRWWGDRVSLTASIGIAQVHGESTLARLLLQAQEAMQASIYAGGNQVTHQKGESCSR